MAVSPHREPTTSVPKARTAVGGEGGGHDRLDVIQQLGTLRDAGVLTSADFKSLKELALDGYELVRIDELQRLDALRNRDYVDAHEFESMIRQIVDENLGQRRCHVVLVDYGAHPTKVENVVYTLQSRWPRMYIPGKRQALPVTIAEDVEVSLAERWVEIIEGVGGRAELQLPD